MQKKILIYFYSVKMTEQTLKFGDNVLIEKNFCFKFIRHRQNSCF